MLKIRGLKVKREDRQILNGIDLAIKPSEVHALMGPNGSGKSTLAAVLTGHPDIDVVDGSAHIDKHDLLSMSVDERAKVGLFLAFQHPLEVPGVPFLEFLRLSYNNLQKARFGDEFCEMSPFKFKEFVKERMKALRMDTSFLERNLNESFSGGEKKKSEVLQMIILEPKYVILDEIDSGLDVSALKTVAEAVQKLAKELNIGVLVITHYSRILKYLKPEYVHVMLDGRIVESGGLKLAYELDEKGYKLWQNN